MYQSARTQGREGAPLVFTFHGTGGTESQFHELASQLMPKAHVVSPRGDVNEMGALRYFRRTGEGVYDMDDLAQRTQAMSEFMLAERARIGAEKIVGLGYSNGANILVSVMLENPGIVTNAILMHPLIPWTPKPQAGLSGRRVLITAGRQDPICPAPMTEALAEYLTEQGVDLTLHWHDGGHEIRQDELGAITSFLAEA